MINTRFIPARGVEKNLLANQYTEGMIYFATDSGRIFLDANGENKIPLGGGGVSIIYGYDSNVIEDVVEQTYTFHIDALQEGVTPKVEDLIINNDGKFYKIQEILLNDGLLICTLIAVSGTGGGTGGGGEVTSVIKIEQIESLPLTLIYGEPYNVSYKVTSEVDDLVTIACQIINETTKEEKPILYFESHSGEICTFDIGSYLFKGSNYVRVWGEDNNGNRTNDFIQKSRNAIEMLLNESPSFNPLKIVDNGVLSFGCIPIGKDLNTKQLVIQVDPEKNGKIITQTVATSQREVWVDIPITEYGFHTVKAYLTYGTGNSMVVTKPLVYEIACVNDTSDEPIIWLDTYPAQIADHDKLIIQYKVYDPKNISQAETRLYVNQDEIPTSPVIVSYDNSNWVWEKWQVTNYSIGTNVLTLTCGKTNRSISFKVVKDEIRDLDIIPTGLYLNLDSRGRSNKENQTIRNKWEYINLGNEKTSVHFNNFNWYNNGWILDENDDSCLRISNGSSIAIPLNVLNTEKLNSGLTFEFEFKLRNVQNYATLITTTSTTTEDGEVIITKTANTEEGVFGRYFGNNIGLCLGTQEAFFKTSLNAIVNGRYKENEKVHVSFVLEQLTETNNTPLLYIYINGIMSGIQTYSSNDMFSALEKEFIINSDYCDVDLYKMRVYKKALTSAEVVHNYIADYADAELYDMNQLLDNNSALPMIDFEKMLEFNIKNPDNQIMPYVVVSVHGTPTTEKDEYLPFVKDGKKRLDVDFVNPALDRAYELGKITGEQYLCGCPSFHAENAEFDVQGTSSQGYPRRNYKGKFKSKEDKPVVWTYVNGPLKGQSLQDKINYKGKDYKYYYMDNKDAAESTFTWKADYMESSGTHNTGFASFVKTLYSKHPLKDYDSNYITGDHRTTIYGFPMLVFQKHKTGEKAGTYEFIGKYNFNLDKACNKVIDFENGNVQPYIANNPNVLEEYRTYRDEETGELKPATYEMIAECWEFAHNQGGRCSFKEVNFAKTYPEGKKLLTVTDDLEVRYNYYKDEIEKALKLDGYSSESANEYLLKKYRNLERLFNWVDSTNTEKANPERELEEPVTYDNKTYTHDTSEYRLAKFEKEFEEHFDKEYCSIYFIMTELILGYDSRGKNMMLGSWGPKTNDGDYIWYPMFYDIDTQLGVNNSGVPTWEYDTNATRDNQFSTSDSVLWNNFWACFSANIKETYIKLRKNELTIEKLNGYYDFNPAISNSYAMKGGRPLIAYNIDEYYKYIAPAFSGYINTTGDIAYTETFFYCLQGTRELQRELFLRNRFNFIDSEWLAGAYSVNAVQMQFKSRYNANDAENTSDKFIDSMPDYMLPDYEKPEDMSDETLAALRAKYEAFKKNDGDILPWNESPLDADASMTIKPYLKQYVSVYYDENTPTAPKEYKGEEPIHITPPDSVQNSVLNTPTFTQQLMYIGGLEYISSFGDVSKKYYDEFKIEPAIRLKDLILGNETPGYKNLKLNNDNFKLDAGAKTSAGLPNPQAKPLLETIVLTNLSGLNAEMDISGSEKLKTCRALGTNLTGLTFADGVQLETLYLPKTIAYFNLIEPVELNGLLNTKPVADENGVYPTGIYIQDLTDADEVTDKTVSKLNSINIVGGKKLYYDSYKIIDKIVQIKEKMQENAELSNEYDKVLRINLENIQWSPYRQVEYGEEIISTSIYYKLTDNYTLIPYTPELEWDKDTLNGKIYEYNENLLNENNNILTDLTLFNKFIKSFGSAENYFRSTKGIGENKTIPYISGNVFINNDENNPISEYSLKTDYKDKFFPDLNIFVKYVDPAYTAKFIYVQDNEQEIEWDVIKYKKDVKNPTISGKENPEKLHYDFKGWSLSIDGPILTENDFKELIFSEENPVYTFYAVFDIHKYWVEFKNVGDAPTDPYRYRIEIESGKPLYEPIEYLPYKDSADLKLEEVWKFIGYSSEANGSILVDLTELLAVKNYTFYAVFEKDSVYNNIIDFKYLNFAEYNYIEGKYGNSENNANGYIVSPAEGVKLTGKITIPAKYNDKYILAIKDFYDQEITHLFFEKGNTLRKIEANTFHKSTTAVGSIEPYCKTLKYFDFTDSIREIGNYAFMKIPLSEMNTIIMPENLYYIGKMAFNLSFSSLTPITIQIGSKLSVLNFLSIANNQNVPSGSTIIIGDESNKSELDLSKHDSTDKDGYTFISYGGFTRIDFYSSNYRNADETVKYENIDRTIREYLSNSNQLALQVIN